jgi:hypothetical protein
MTVITANSCHPQSPRAWNYNVSVFIMLYASAPGLAITQDLPNCSMMDMPWHPFPPGKAGML